MTSGIGSFVGCGNTRPYYTVMIHHIKKVGNDSMRGKLKRAVHSGNAGFAGMFRPVSRRFSPPPRGVRLFRVGRFENPVNPQSRDGMASCHYHIHLPPSARFHDGTEISTTTTRSRCRSPSGISDSSAALSSDALAGRSSPSGSLGIFRPFASPDQRMR